MMRSMTLLSSTVAIAAISADSVAANAAQHWYPDFAADYKSGACTTAPSAALIAFAMGSVNPDVSTLAQSDKESCCETWFPQQEGCGCLGGCSDIDEVDSVTTAPTAAEPLAEEVNYWYPAFEVAYEAGKCVKFGVNTNHAPPSYYTQESGFLHSELSSCCAQWFEFQDSKMCKNALNEFVMMQPTSSHRGSNGTQTVPAAVEPMSSIQVQASIVAEDSL